MFVRSFSGDQRGVFFGTAALFFLALAFGGLGPHAPLLSGLIEAAAFPMLVAIVLLRGIEKPARSDQIAATSFILLLLVLGLSQLIPIAPDAWRSLPGRDGAELVLEAVGAPNQNRPLSLAPVDTRLALQSWLPPITIFVATLLSSHRERQRLAWLVILVAAISSAVGLIQLSFGDGTFFPEPPDIVDRYPGLFANYNHQAIFLAAAVALLPVLTDAAIMRSQIRRWGIAPLFGLLLIGALITASRAGLALFGLSSVLTVFRLVPSPQVSVRKGQLTRRWVAFACLSVASLLIALWFASDGYRVEMMGSRFEGVSDDARYEFWATTLEAIRTFMPFGTGFGTFEPAYALIEPLEGVRNFVVNHAHNDYLEVALEAGAAGIGLIFLFTAWFVVRVFAIIRQERPDRTLAWSGAIIVSLVMLHSVVDYPLRTQAIGCTFAFACAVLIGASTEEANRRVRHQATRREALSR